MGQPRIAASCMFFIGCAMALGGCREKPPAATTQPSPDPRTKVASLVPAATDLILGMEAGDHLVAVSNFDPAEIGGRKLPRVGDYQTTDWEMLASLRPGVMVIQMDAGRLGQGFAQKAQGLGIRLVNVRMNTLADLLAAVGQIGQAIGETGKGESLAGRLSGRIEALRKTTAGRAPVRTLFTLDETGEALVGPGTFLDDLLRVAGGVNAAASLGAEYPRADHETLLKLQPEVVIVLKPRAKEGTLLRAEKFWKDLRGEKVRVYLLRESYVLLPGAHVAEVAEAMERCIRGEN